MTRWENHSGSAISVPVVGRDVADGEVVEVPDDVVLPANYFRVVEARKATVKAKGEGE